MRPSGEGITRKAAQNYSLPLGQMARGEQSQKPLSIHSLDSPF
jgi:hypothetical protein